jgi:hypothetical protein
LPLNPGDYPVEKLQRIAENNPWLDDKLEDIQLDVKQHSDATTNPDKKANLHVVLYSGFAAKKPDFARSVVWPFPSDRLPEHLFLEEIGD